MRRQVIATNQTKPNLAIADQMIIDFPEYGRFPVPCRSREHDDPTLVALIAALNRGQILLKDNRTREAGEQGGLERDPGVRRCRFYLLQRDLRLGDLLKSRFPQ